MAESAAELAARLQAVVASGFRSRLLDKGLARGMIWRDGTLPEGAPEFADGLSEDLLDYAHTVMSLALRLRGHSRSQQPAEELIVLLEKTILPVLGRAFLVAGEAIEAAVHRGEERHDRGFHRVTAAVAFHLGRYAARAYSMLPERAGSQNFSPTETALVQLLRRRLDDLHAAFSNWLLDPVNGDAAVAARLTDDEDFDEVDAVHLVLTSSFMRGLALFDYALATGRAEFAAASQTRLKATADAASDLNAVSHWWTATMAAHLVDELWDLSFHNQIPELPPGDADHARWRDIRRGYIQRLRAGKRAAIELWPSQLTAVKRALNPTDDLVVALPTSAGKTRIAELCILRALASEKRVVYVTPLRALSAQTERDLADSLTPLGISVSSLYGAAGVSAGDEKTLREGQVVVSTPEKLDFALRNDPSIIDDVGLVVLDEGHMLGPNEREVRYEALVQRLVRRADAAERRIVCLSALFPTPDEMSDLVGWLRADEPGEPVHSVWRPTRQRFGVLRWKTNGARLDVNVEEESPWVEKFIEPRDPPNKKLRRKPFPADKNELTLAAAWRFVEQQKDVLIYCALRSSVETQGRLVLECIRQGVLQPLRQPTQRVKDAIAAGAEWLGVEHPAVACLEHGVALHHGGLPRPFLNEVERLLRAGDCPVTIASPTLAQGLNLSASVLLVPSIWRSKEVIPADEFANVAGRAGRAFVDVEGLVLHIVWEHEPGKRAWAVKKWNELVAAAKAPQVESGILALAVIISERIALKADISVTEVIDYVTGHDEAWDFDPARLAEVKTSAADWERDVASLDAAILALLDGETDDDEVESELDSVLEGSLFSRQLSRAESELQKRVRAFVAARAQRIWSETTPAQRKGYHDAGVGLAAGRFVDANLDSLVQLLSEAESGISSGDADATGAAVVAFAELVFQTAPFQAPKELPAKWREALLAWLAGQLSSEVVALCDEEGVDLIQEALAYRLPWAMEAVRVHALAVKHANAESITGLAALAVEAGSSNISVITLVRAGLSSREAASAAVESTDADFNDVTGMLLWLASEEVKRRSGHDEWPTVLSRPAWLRFYEVEHHVDRRKWRRERESVEVTWTATALPAGTPVIVELGEQGGVFSPAFDPLGHLNAPIRGHRRDLVSVVVSASGNALELEYFGPRALR